MFTFFVSHILPLRISHEIVGNKCKLVFVSHVFLVDYQLRLVLIYHFWLSVINFNVFFSSYFILSDGLEKFV